MTDKPFEGRTALIMGATDDHESNIGNQTARVLAKGGSNIIVVDDQECPFTTLRSGIDTSFHVIRIATESLMHPANNCVQEIATDTGLQIDTLVFSDLKHESGELETMSVGLMNGVVYFNMVAPTLWTQSALRYFLAHNDGRPCRVIAALDKRAPAVQNPVLAGSHAYLRTLMQSTQKSMSRGPNTNGHDINLEAIDHGKGTALQGTAEHTALFIGNRIKAPKVAFEHPSS